MIRPLVKQGSQWIQSDFEPLLKLQSMLDDADMCSTVASQIINIKCKTRCVCVCVCVRARVCTSICILGIGNLPVLLIITTIFSLTIIDIVYDNCKKNNHSIS